MERVEWLKLERERAEKLYSLWGLYGQREQLVGSYESETHLEYLRKFLERIPLHSTVLSAGCGAGRNDEILLEAGHRVMGIDQSEGMLTRAREYFPNVRYEKIGLQEMDFREEFDGVTCIDALELVCPEDWPGGAEAAASLVFRGGLRSGACLRHGYRVAAAFRWGGSASGEHQGRGNSRPAAPHAGHHTVAGIAQRRRRGGR